MEIIMKTCDISYIDALTDFYHKVTGYLDTHINYPKWIQGVYPGRESIKAAIDSGSQYACFCTGRIVGAFVLNDDPAGSYYKGEWQSQLNNGEYMVVHALAVDPNESGRGIASKMVEYCLETAQTLGYKAVRLDVVPGNHPAKRLYEKAGFRFAGVKDLDRGIEEIPMFELYEKNF